CRLLARDHSARWGVLSRARIYQYERSPRPSIAWCSRPRTSTASLEGALMDEQLYREIILDHYKNPRGHGVIEGADAEAEGMNPLCGDEVAIYVAFGEDGETIEDVKFSGRGCAISQAATSMLMEMAKGRTATEVATLPKDELLEEIGVPLQNNPT